MGERGNESRKLSAQGVLLRVLLVYLGLWGVRAVAEMLPFAELLVPWYADAWLPLARALGGLLLGPEVPVEVVFNGSGDTPFLWMWALAELLVASVTGAVWAAIDARAGRQRRLAPLAVAWLRNLLALNMLAYGGLKVLGSQFGDLGPSVLARPLGDFSPQALMWSFMAHSNAYETFGGLAEVLGGVLLLRPRTSTLGALVVVGVMSNVAMLNYCYDIPVKLGSTQLLLAASGLVALDGRRLWAGLVRGSAVEARVVEPTFTTVRGRWIGRVSQVVLLGLLAFSQVPGWLARRGPAPTGSEVMGFYAIESSCRGDVERGCATLAWRGVGLWGEVAQLHDQSGEVRLAPLRHDEQARTIELELEGEPPLRFSYVTVEDGLRLDAGSGCDPIHLRRRQAEDFRLVRHRTRLVDQRTSAWD